MIDRRQSSQLNSSMDLGLYSNTLREIASLLTASSNPETLFTHLHSYLKDVIPLQRLELGLFSSTKEHIDWVFIANKGNQSFEVLKSEFEPFWNEVISKERSVAHFVDKEDRLVEICSPIRLHSKNLGLIKLEILDDSDIPKWLELIDLVACFLAFRFSDLMVVDNNLVCQNVFLEELKITTQLNEKLLSIIDVARALAHELNQPLTGISGYCTLIMEAIDEDASQSIMNDLENILKQAARLENLIFKFQNIAHIEGRPNKIVL